MLTDAINVFLHKSIMAGRIKADSYDSAKAIFSAFDE